MRILCGLIGGNLSSASIQCVHRISAMHPRTAAILFTAPSKNGNMKSIFHLSEVFANAESTQMFCFRAKYMRCECV